MKMAASAASLNITSFTGGLSPEGLNRGPHCAAPLPRWAPPPGLLFLQRESGSTNFYISRWNQRLATLGMRRDMIDMVPTTELASIAEGSPRLRMKPVERLEFHRQYMVMASRERLVEIWPPILQRSKW